MLNHEARVDKMAPPSMKEELQTLPLEALYSSFRKLVRKLLRTNETDTNDAVSNHGLKTHRREFNAIGWQRSLTPIVQPCGMIIILIQKRNTVIRDTDRETCIERDRTIP